MVRRKFENVEDDLEQLRAAEGKWLEEKRLLAQQLVNETDNRRQAEKKLEAAGTGDAVPKKELDKLKKELDQSRKDLVAAKKKS